jgi:hypothetical protein
MPRVHEVQRARKAIPGTDVARGDHYYWWKFRFGGKHVSKTYPDRSQLTQDDFLISLYAHEDGLQITTDTHRHDYYELLRSTAEEVEQLGQTEEGKVDNLPENFQESSPNAERWRSRNEKCREIAEALRVLADEVEGWKPDKAAGERWGAWRDLARDALFGIDWSVD